jgi:uridine kinase
MYSNQLYELVEEVIGRTARIERPLVIALDGPSGAGKSTVAEALKAYLEVAVIPLDDFFAANIPDSKWDAFTIEERRKNVFQWDRLRVECIQPLLEGSLARWRAFDFEAGLQEDGTYLMKKEGEERCPANVILIEGAYSASPELVDLIDMTVLVIIPKEKRQMRLRARDGEEFSKQWLLRWESVEEYYFNQVRPMEYYDFVLAGDYQGT